MVRIDKSKMTATKKWKESRGRNLICINDIIEELIWTMSKWELSEWNWLKYWTDRTINQQKEAEDYKHRNSHHGWDKLTGWYKSTTEQCRQ